MRVAIVVVSVLLGFASGWNAEELSILRLLLHSLLILGSLWIFILVLPKRISLPIQIFVAMVAGALAGWLLSGMGEAELVTDYLGIFGTLFILLLKMVIIPLVFVSIVCGVAGIGDIRKLGSLGVKTLVYYSSTTAIAVLIGLFCVNAIRPGVGRETLGEEVQRLQTIEDSRDLSTGMKIQKSVLPEFVQNPVMRGSPILAVIFFALLLGAALAAKGEQSQPAIAFFKAMDGAMTAIVHGIMYLAPIGVFALMGKATATLGIDYILLLAKYCFTVLLGLGLHFCVLTFVILIVVGRMSPLRFLRGMSPAIELAFSTSSSSATLPVTIDCASERVGVSRNVCSFMLPLGATINMDGTALYQAVSCLFIAQVYGLDLSIQQQFIVFATASIVSLGVAGIPGASIGMMSIVLASAGIPVEGVGIVIGVERFLDMCRTLVNVTGDSVGTVVVGRSEGGICEQ